MHHSFQLPSFDVPPPGKHASIPLLTPLFTFALLKLLLASMTTGVVANATDLCTRACPFLSWISPSFSGNPHPLQHLRRKNVTLLLGWRSIPSGLSRWNSRRMYVKSCCTVEFPWDHVTSGLMSLLDALSSFRVSQSSLKWSRYWLTVPVSLTDSKLWSLVLKTVRNPPPPQTP